MSIPQEIKNIIQKLNQAGFEAYIVGGCVRDLLLVRHSFSDNGLGRKPKDWDVCTNALPEEIQKIFPNSFYENRFGTVTVMIKATSEAIEATLPQSKLPQSDRGNFDEILRQVEITTFRVDEKYTDKRHPDEVRFTTNLEDDLARRDFTINAIALRLSSKQAPKIIDPFGGQDDLKSGLIKAVGNPVERFNEDALRMIRAIRFVIELNSYVEQSSTKYVSFTIEEKTAKAIRENAGLIQAISKERIRDELIKIIMADLAADGLVLLQELNLLQYIIPELVKGIGVGQNRHHIYTIFEHGIFSLKFAAQKKYNLIVRLAALLHDIGKQQAKRGEGLDSTFYNHDHIGARIAARILDRLRFPRLETESIINLIKNHMFVYDIGAVSEAGIRRLLRRVGPENMKNLIALRVADRLGSGVPKAQPYRLRHFQYMVEKVQHDAISVKQLKINGHDIMKILDVKPGPKIGAILDVLLAEAIENPSKNEKKRLAERTKQLNEADLIKLRTMAKEKIEEKKEEENSQIKGKYWVK